MNVVLAVFNLLPIPPLDGSWIASWGLPRHLGDLYDRYMEPYGFIILIALWFLGILRWIIFPIAGLIVRVLLFFLY